MNSLSRAGFIAGASAALVRPAAAEAAPAKLSDIDHIILLMQENRSFDHYFGTLSGVRGFDDARAVSLQDGKPVFYQPDSRSPDGYVLPFHLDTKTTSAQRLHDLSHAWFTLHDSWDGGRLDGWVSSHRRSNGSFGTLTMGYYTRDDIPFHYALADAFTICDGYHCSVLGPTDPNRYYWMTASIDPNGRGGGPETNNAERRRLTWETYPERLERAGISWRIYRPESTPEYPNGLDVIMHFVKFQDAPPNSALYDSGVKVRSVETLLDDIRTGNLPSVTWIIPPYAASEHPDMLPAAGEDYVRNILETLWSNPKLWSRTAFIVSYDENDGLFDHVVPPTPPPGTPGEFIDGVPIGLGFRVPCLVISPFSRGGLVCGDTFDHTSTLRFIEARFGVEVPNLSRWRRETCGDLTSAFDFSRPIDTSVPLLPTTADRLRLVEQQVTRLPSPGVPREQSMPKQESSPNRRRLSR